MKFDSPKATDFLYRINDSERNDQIRNLAFRHLQKTGHYVKLRSKFKGKKKSYTTNTSSYEMTPEMLLARINEDTIQSKKSYEAFISHSYKDADLVYKTKEILNSQGITCYCDWMSDSDFLKRNLVSEYTEMVLRKRIEQSDMIIFIRTLNSMPKSEPLSPWIKMELDCAKDIGKTIYCIDCVGDGINLPYKKIKCDFEKRQIFI